MLSTESLKKRILVFGANGMLGQRTVLKFSEEPELYEILLSSAEPTAILQGMDYVQADLTKREEVKKVIHDFVPDYIVNCAAYTNVDGCEKERDLSWKVNVSAVEFMAEGARAYDSAIVHISSDYVFDGTKGYYTETDLPNPISYYGRTKLAAENALKISGVMNTIIRTNVLYGVIAAGRNDFVRWVVESLRQNKPIRIVTDQINNPTYLDDLAGAIYLAVKFKKFGLYNIGGAEFMNRYEFTLKIADYFNLDKSLISPITTAELNQPAPRPLKSGLVNLKAETELGYKPHSLEETFAKIKKSLDGE